jgi:arylsulfatase A-like enzyme
VKDPSREAATMVSAAVVVAFIAAVATALPEIAANNYWAAHCTRLAADRVWVRFDSWAPIAACLALSVTIAARLVGHALSTRRAPVSSACFLALTLVLVLRLAAAIDAWSAADGPNVLLVSIDTLRADHLGAYGYGLPTSPAIDRRLADAGVTFENVYSQSPKTTPSHMTMLTSLYPCAHGIELWVNTAPGHVLNPRVQTLAEVLKDAGYATAAFTGGVHLHRSRGFDQGFDIYRHGLQLEQALQWISANRGRKWFVFFHTFEVHDPYVPPPRLVREFDPLYQGPIDDALKKIRRGVDGGWEAAHKLFWGSVDTANPREVQFVERLYDAGIRAMDERTLSPLLDRLDALALTNNTLVVFTSDHGEAFGEHGRFMHDDVRGGTLHVPLILRFPGRLPAGRRVAPYAGVVDVMPTILDLLDLPIPPEAQGYSLARLARGEVSRASPHGVLMGEYSPGALYSMRKAGFTYLIDGQTESLFKGLDSAPETRDLAQEQSSTCGLARTEFKRWKKACARVAARLGPGSATVVPDAQTIKGLRALGYIQ